MASFRALAAAQTVPVPGNVEANLGQHLELVEAAAAEGARLVVFPELSLTGYELDRARALAFSEDDARLGPLVEAARSTDTLLVVGAPVRSGGELHIGAFIVSPDGTTDLYTKHHLGAFPAGANPGGPVPPAEASVFQAGDRNPPLSRDGYEAAIAICADLGKAEHAQRAARRGARTYLASAFVIPRDLPGDVARLGGYATEHRMAVVFSNFGGPSGGLPSAGRTAIWSDAGDLVVRLGSRGRGVAVAIEDGAGAWRGGTVTWDDAG